jgi:cell division transport system permease protein
VRLGSIEFLIHEVREDVKRGGTARAAPIVIIGITLFVLGLFLVVTVNLRKGIVTAQGKVEMVVFARDESPESLDAIEAGLAAITGVREVRFVSREEALVRFRRDLGDKPELLDAMSSNPLPSSFEVAIYDDYKSTDRLMRIAAAAQTVPGIEGVRYGEEWVGRLQRLIVIAVLIDIFLGILLGISTIVSVANTLKLALLHRRESIEVMRLVGASDGMIRGPVFVEGALLGIVAAGLAAAGLYACYVFLAGRITELAFLDAASLTAFILTGGLLGGFGSVLALERLLEENVAR